MRELWISSIRVMSRDRHRLHLQSSSLLNQNYPWFYVLLRRQKTFPQWFVCFVEEIRHLLFC